MSLDLCKEKEGSSLTHETDSFNSQTVLNTTNTTSATGHTYYMIHSKTSWLGSGTKSTGLGKRL